VKKILLFVLVASALSAQQTGTDLPGVDFSGLTPAQKKTAAAILRDDGCACGCSMKIAECRVKDPKCAVSRSMAAMIIKELHDGKSAEEARAAVAAKIGGPRAVLEGPVVISIDGDPVKGPSDAKITLVEFSDFQCPYCSKAVAEADAVLRKYPKDVRLVFKQFPLDAHSQARMAAEASLAAHAQGKFWPMHDKLFANSHELSRDHILGWAKEIGLDMTKFKGDFESGKYKSAVEREISQGETAGVEGTPSFFVNGKHYNGGLELAEFGPILEAEMKTARK
jgi:protein-disulfide isomerase